MSLLYFTYIIYTYRCKLRILDSFGTEARFNYLEPIDERYTGLMSINNEQKKHLMAGNHSYAGWKLNLKQFLTMFRKLTTNSDVNDKILIMNLTVA